MIAAYRPCTLKIPLLRRSRGGENAAQVILAEIGGDMSGFLRQRMAALGRGDWRSTSQRAHAARPEPGMAKGG